MVACLLPWIVGCESAKQNTLTGRLWDNAALNHCKPAGRTNLRLYQTADRKDVLVRYNELRESNGAVDSRAFLIFANQPRLDAGKKPLFLSVGETAKIQSTPLDIIPSIDSSSEKDEAMQAIISGDGHHFTLVSEGREIGSYDLPTYLTKGSRVVKLARANTFTRLVATPAAATGDVAIYSATAALFALTAGGPCWAGAIHQ